MGKQAASKLIYSGFLLFILLLAGVTATGALAIYASPAKHPLIAYIGMALPGLLIINVLLLAYGLLRKKWLAVIPFLAILTNIGYLSAVFQYSATKHPGEKSLKIATYNIHSFNKEKTGYSAKQIAKYMENEQVDILCFQEFNGNRFFSLDSLYAAFNRYPHKYVPRLPNNHTRIAILSKYPLTDSLFIPFPKTENCSMYADVAVNGKKLRVFNAHMQTTALSRLQYQLEKEQAYATDNKSKEVLENISQSLLENTRIRANQADYLHTVIEKSPYPVLLCGDFNDTPASYTYHVLKGKLQDGFKTCGNGYQYTFRNLFKLLRIDYIFHSPDIKGIHYHSPSLKWSDHNPVIMEIEIE